MFSLKRLNKTVAAFFAILLLALTACGDTSIPEGMNEEDLFNAGKDVALLLVDGDYDRVLELLREDQRELVSADDIAAAVDSQINKAGEYKYISDHVITGQKIDGDPYAIVTLYCEFSKSDVLVRITFDTEMQLVGFSLDRK